MPDTQSLLEKISALPPDWVAEVEDFVDFLIERAEREAALDRLLAIAPALEAACATPPSEEEILSEIAEVRRGRSLAIAAL